MPGRKNKLDLLPDLVIETIGTLRDRIQERFGERGLTHVCGRLFEIAKLDAQLAIDIERNYTILRALVNITASVGGAAAALSLMLIVAAMLTTTVNLATFVQGIEAAVNLVLLTGALAFSLFTWERRVKRRRTLPALHELRSVVHVIDMHQLAKDPSKFISGGNTPSSPRRELDEFQMTRYLEYCTEMLSLASKIAVVLGQALDDTAIAEVVSDIEHVSTGLSQKIGQKISILQQLREADLAAAALSAAGGRMDGP